jgi:TerC family integral membrane protein
MVSSVWILALLVAFEGATSFTTVRVPVQSADLLARHDVASQQRLFRQGSQLNVLSKNKELNEAQATAIKSSSDDTLESLTMSQDDEKDMYRTAIQKTLIWVGAAVAFGTCLGVFVDSQTAEEFFAGYLLEQSLSVDNLLVFLLLFEYFKIPLSYQNRILNWGIIGAIVMRAAMIGAGAVALQQFHAVLLGFAAILIYSSAKVLIGSDDDEEEDFSQNAIVKFSNNIIESTNQFDGDRFFTLVDGVKMATPMLLCMVAVEFSDVVFAVDSIPAVFGVTEVSLQYSACYPMFWAFVHLPLLLIVASFFSFVVIESLGRFLLQYVRNHGTSESLYHSLKSGIRPEISGAGGCRCPGFHWIQNGCRILRCHCANRSIVGSCSDTSGGWCRSIAP